MIKREIQKEIKELVNQYPVLALTGPRQSGKTTLLKNLFRDYEYISLEDPDQRDFAQKDPRAFLKKFNSKVIFDEVQRVPSLFSYIQTIVDESGEMGQFILSGSQNFLLLENITQSLAGRVAIFKLFPFDMNELSNANLLNNSFEPLILQGSYPAIYSRNLTPSRYYSNYIKTYIEKDVRNLQNIHDKSRFSNFLTLCANRAGQLLNLNSLSIEAGISFSTAKSWLSILESSYIVFLLQPYFENFNKRIVKSPKLYFFDTGLLSYLIGIRTEEEINYELKGILFENLIVSDILKQNHHQYKLEEYWFWRDSNQHEVDLLKKRGTKFDIYEIKSTQTISYKLIKNLEFFKNNSGDKVLSMNLIYGGLEEQKRTQFNIKSWQNPI